jgi:hypothetical protein
VVPVETSGAAEAKGGRCEPPRTGEVLTDARSVVGVAVGNRSDHGREVCGASVASCCGALKSRSRFGGYERGVRGRAADAVFWRSSLLVVIVVVSWSRRGDQVCSIFGGRAVVVVVRC